MTAISRVIIALAIIAASGAASLFGYSAMRAQVAQDIYRRRLEHLAGDYASLREQYNQAVRRTAVTELVVEGGRLTVRIRSADGVLAEVPTPYDPAKEIFVDFAIIDGRLWIRRVYDEDTPPKRATIIDPSVADIDWDEAGAAYGTTVYRSLEEGRWVITVSGDGALRLTQSAGAVDLQPPPEIKSFDELEREVRGELENIGPAEVLRRFLEGR